MADSGDPATARPGAGGSSPFDHSRWEADVVLADGGTMHVRPIRPDDGDRMMRFHERQSPESIYFRYFSPRPRLSSRDVERFTQVDYADRMAFVGLIGDEMVGVARYDRHPARGDAEVAFFTDDSHAGRGMATVLLEYLAAAARDAGITGFTAQVLPANRRMLSVFQQAGFAATSRFSDGVIEVELAIDPTDEALAAMAARASVSEARSVARILSPRSVAVVGASRRSGTLGHAVFRQLIDAGFEGPVYPVNPEATHVGGVRAYPSLLDVPDEIDLAVVVVPADQVLEVIEHCGRKRVQGLVVISSGFAEAGTDGAGLEHRAVAAAHAHGMRMVGPNTMGVINTAPGVRLHASFTDVRPAAGRIGVSSQSGTIGAALLDELCRHGLGVSSFVATGNKADVSGNDLLQYWEQDERTDLVVLYLESFGNPKNFGRIARRVGRTMPIVAVKAGRSVVAAQGAAADDPAEALIDPAGWPADVSFDALLRQTGVLRVDAIEQLVDVTRVLAHQPLPSGRRVAVLSNFWGPAVLAADACRAAGLDLAELHPGTVEALEAGLRPSAVVGNPVQLTFEAGPVEYALAVRHLLDDPGTDAVLVVHAPASPPRTAEVARAVAAEAQAGRTTPVVASFLGPHEAGALDDIDALPVFPFPEAAAYALGRVAQYAEWRAGPEGSVPDLDRCDPEGARLLATQLLDGKGEVVLAPDQAHVLLSTFGIDAVAQWAVDDLDEALERARAIGYPVALKALGIERPAKTEAGGLAVDVYGDAELEAAYRRMTDLHGPAMKPALVQAMAPVGVDVAVGLHQHPQLGSVVTLGLEGRGGTPLVRILPLTDVDARSLVESAEAVDGAAADVLCDLLLRLSALAEVVPELAQARLDPVLVSPRGAVPTDLRLHLAPWDRSVDPAVRRLRT